ncbi:MAG TPA: hypothetical protein VLB49_16700 [Gemmatimonadales bacterium]|nr:hypothetical protein [Gemmatimonadales bacterium]
MDAYSDLDLVVVAAPSAWPGVLEARGASLVRSAAERPAVASFRQAAGAIV